MQSIAELHKMVIGPSDLNKMFHYFFRFNRKYKH